MEMMNHVLKLLQTISGEVPSDIPEVKRLRWLANMWPEVANPKDDADKMSNCIHLYCTSAADRMVAMSEAVDFARTINAENVRLKAELEKVKNEREKGCVYCTGDRMPLETDGGGDLEVVELIPLPAINLTTGERESTAQPPYFALCFRAFEGELEDFVPIRCCPMCGRLLKEEVKHE